MNTEERIEETFTVGEAPQVSVSNVRGNVIVKSAERDDIYVTAVKRKDGCKNPERTQVELYQDGARVVVKTRYQERRGSRVCPVDYTVSIPTHCQVTVRHVTGTVSVTGVTGQVDVNTVEGEVALREIDGHTRVRAVSARLDGDRWSGQAHVNTISGPVQIAGARLSRLKANTVSGDLSFETTVDDEGRYDFNSVSGDVTLYLPEERGVESRGTTISGHLVCDLPHEFSRRDRGGWRAAINGGGPPVRFNSISGDLELLARKPV